jgi:trehalose synthase
VLAEGEWQALREACEAAAVSLDLRSYDAVVVQGAGSAALIEGRLSGGDWLWRTGADASGAGEEALAAFGPLLEDYRSLSFALPGFALPGAPEERLHIVAGAFDPLGERPVARGPWPAGLDPARPLLCHVGRLDAWADPIAAVEAWELAREEAPGLQLAVAGRVDPADPEAIGVLEEVRAFAAGEEDLHLVTDRGGAGAERIAAVATLARCAMRCTVGGEFDPVVAESQWRGTPVVGEGPAIAAQVAEGEGGFVAEGAAAQAERIAALATDARLALEVARAGRDRVLERFSMPRLLAEEVETLERLLGVDRGRDADAPAPRPPGRTGARA